MALTQRLELRQSQALVMTPQLQQAIKMLQLSNLELAEFVDGEIEQNPLLEQAAREGDDAPAATTELDRAGGADGPGPGLDLPHALAPDVAEDAAEHWRAVSGSDGDGTHDAFAEPEARSQP